MPTLTPVGYPSLGTVRLTLDWSDNIGVRAVKIYRVDAEGNRSLLRMPPPVDANGASLLSNSRLVVWDSEAPAGQAVSWVAESTDTATVLDTWTRNVSGGWGTPDIGGAYTEAVPAESFANGSLGYMALSPPALNISVASSPDVADFDAVVETRMIWQKPEFVGANSGLAFRVVPLFQLYYCYLEGSGQDFDLMFLRLQTIGGPAGSVDRRVNVSRRYGAVAKARNWDEWYKIRVLAEGTRIRCKAWRRDWPEPDVWALDVTDDAFVTGKAGVTSGIGSVGTVQSPYDVYFDNMAYRPIGLTSSTGTGPMVIGDQAWLTNPLHPWASVPLTLDCPSPIDDVCNPDSIVLLSSLGDEVFDADSIHYDVVDYPRPIANWHVRKNRASSMVLATTDRQARDWVEGTLAPGNPLLLNLPPAYDFDPAYISVGNVTRSRLARDHTRKPRLHTMPFLLVDAPVGPADGVLGGRWTDQCGTYANYAAMTAASVTWQQVASGEAS